MRLSLFTILCICTLAAKAYETPDSIKNQYRALYDLPVESHADGSKSFHQARLFHREGLRILFLKGDEFEMGFQHGRLLQKEIPDGALPQTAKLLENAVRNALPPESLISEPAISLFYRRYSDRILEHAIQERGKDGKNLLLEAYGLSEGAQIKLDTVIYGVLGPESLQVALGETLKGKKGVSTAGVVSSCTDFVVKPELTKEKGMIIGRNTDYPLNGFFDKYPTVIYYEPTDGTQRYLSVTSAGLHNAGVIALNESGLFIGVHTIPTTEVSSKGNPVFLVGQEVMRKAKSFDEAVQIFKKHKPAAGWTYTLASVFENRVAGIEITNRSIGVREEVFGFHTQSNHFLSDTLKNSNLEINATITEDSEARLFRAQELIEKNSTVFTSQDAVNILSDKWDPIHQEVRGLVNVIAVNTTLSSAVFDFSQSKLFVANGLGPVSLNTYVELPLLNSFSFPAIKDTQYETLKNDRFKSEFPHFFQAEQKYIEAKHFYEMENNPRKAVEKLRESMELDSQNPAYFFMAGILSLKAGMNKEAVLYLEETTQKNYLHYQLVGRYYLARLEASQGNKISALDKYQQVLDEADPWKERTLIQAVKQQVSKLKRARKVRFNPQTLSPFMPEADMLSY